ncbi:hypothetical protein GGX14DRAFT_601777 [Mycena pura]|uniref:Aminoglycoside phosphotransferase domain-containing protein n=1 Tax=Mycena pura TaxID=153505 RepID=A0AAD6YJV0_9AGAR|nr:hypothetical protein GGX14DRAFT_601777 [Mycena pura]
MSDLEKNHSSHASTNSTDSISNWDDLPPNFVPFKATDKPPAFEFSVQDLFQEIKDNLGADVFDIPFVGSGANHFGLHGRLVDGRDVMIRISRYDVNWTKLYKPTHKDAATRVEKNLTQVDFEAKVYALLRSRRDIKASHLLYHRLPVWQILTNTAETPDHLIGRDIFVFEKAAGSNNFWSLDELKNREILAQCARMRAALFSFAVPIDFAKSWLHNSAPGPKVMPSIIAPTRDFAISFISAKVEEMIKNEGDVIGWESDHNVVGPVAFNAKLSLLRLIPVILPLDDPHGALYRLVLEHGDFGIHNMTITDAPTVTSVFDWETGHIVPAILSDPRLMVHCDLEVDEHGTPIISRLWDGMEAEDILEFQEYANYYYQILAQHAPDYLETIKMGKDARHIWFALTAWRGADPEDYFGALGLWADQRYREHTGQDR